MCDMADLMQILKPAVTAFMVAGMVSPPVYAQTDALDELFERLQDVEAAEAEAIENRIWAEWSKSGSDAMDLLLERGREALDEGDPLAAAEHFSALIDHAPDFAEAYNARAMAYFQQERYGLAIDDIRQTLALNPRHFGAMSGLALIMQQLGYEEDALEVWREVVALNPHAEGAAEAIAQLEPRIDGTAL